jgi:hypothetical protein
MPPELDLKKIEILKRRLSAEWKGLDDEAIRDLREQVEHKGSLVSDPALEEKCPKCSYLRRIVEYRLIGKLSDGPVTVAELPGKPQPTAEEVEAKKRRRLKRVESDLARLQKEAEKLRGELGNGGER